jgi:hypothetical protein
MIPSLLVFVILTALVTMEMKLKLEMESNEQLMLGSSKDKIFGSTEL